MHPQDHFVAERRGAWQELDTLLSSARSLHELAPRSISRVGALYRSVCADLMRARSAGYEPELLAHLDGLAARAHNQLYGARPLKRAITRLIQNPLARALLSGTFVPGTTIVVDIGADGTACGSPLTV